MIVPTFSRCNGTLEWLLFWIPSIPSGYSVLCRMPVGVPVLHLLSDRCWNLNLKSILDFLTFWLEFAASTQNLSSIDCVESSSITRCLAFELHCDALSGVQASLWCTVRHLTQFILVRLLEYTRFKLLRNWSMDLIPRSLDARVTRPTHKVDASMTRIFIGFLANPQPSTGLMRLYRLPFESG